jgi:haloacetate dehalogenase
MQVTKIATPSDVDSLVFDDLIPYHSNLMEGFKAFDLPGIGAKIHGVIGGSGPPLLLIHGNPLTHVTWHKIAPTLAKHYTVVAIDLRGYGDSEKPLGGGDHSDYSFRTMANDAVQVMQELGYSKFAVVGHDRGARVGFRMSLDYPDKVTHLISLDIVPTHEVLTRVTMGWGLESYHWFFMAQKEPFPERLICGDLDFYINYKLNKKGVGLKIFAPEAMAEYIRCTTPEQIHAICEDYRATVSIDLEMDTADLGIKKIQCPVLVLWGSNSHCGRHFKPIEAWSKWADDLQGTDIPTGHYPQEERPDLIYKAIRAFVS